MENFIFCAVMLVDSNAMPVSVGGPIRLNLFIQVVRVLIGSRIKSNYHSETAQNEFYPRIFSGIFSFFSKDFSAVNFMAPFFITGLS